MNIKISDEAVEKLARTYYGNLGWEWDDLEEAARDHEENLATILREFRVAFEAAAPLLPRFTYTEEDLLSLARGVVPEWLKFDADAALDEELSK